MIITIRSRPGAIPPWEDCTESVEEEAKALLSFLLIDVTDFKILLELDVVDPDEPEATSVAIEDQVVEVSQHMPVLFETLKVLGLRHTEHVVGGFQCPSLR